MTINATFRTETTETISERGDRREITTIIHNASVVVYPCIDDCYRTLIHIGAVKGDHSTSIILKMDDAKELVDELKEILERYKKE